MLICNEMVMNVTFQSSSGILSICHMGCGQQVCGSEFVAEGLRLFSLFCIVLFYSKKENTILCVHVIEKYMVKVIYI